MTCATAQQRNTATGTEQIRLAYVRVGEAYDGGPNYYYFSEHSNKTISRIFIGAASNGTGTGTATFTIYFKDGTPKFGPYSISDSANDMYYPNSEYVLIEHLTAEQIANIDYIEGIAQANGQKNGAGSVDSGVWLYSVPSPWIDIQ